MLCFFALLCALLADDFSMELLKMPCAEAFEHFVARYTKTYATDDLRQEALRNFCRFHDRLVQVDTAHISFTFYEYCDRPFADIFRTTLLLDTPVDSPEQHMYTRADMPSRRLGSKRKPLKDGLYMPEGCSAWAGVFDPLPRMASIPRSMDLREVGLQSGVMNQGGSGVCWAFATIGVLEAGTLANAPHYKANSNYHPYFASGAGNLNFSVQYLLNCSGNLCQGGSYGQATVYFLTGQAKTQELAKDFPYSGSCYGNTKDIVEPRPKIPRAAYLVPVNLMPLKDGCVAGFVGLFNGAKWDSVWNKTDITRIKSYLARGISICTRLNTNADPAIPMSYSNGIMEIPCVNPGSDHQTAFVGYGYYHNVEVWILRNSWGAWWGIQGYAYFKMGMNCLCSETWASTLLPKYMPLGTTAVYSPNAYSDFNYKHTIVRGKLGLDPDPGRLNTSGAIGMMAVVAGAAMALGGYVFYVYLRMFGYVHHTAVKSKAKATTNPLGGSGGALAI